MAKPCLLKVKNETMNKSIEPGKAWYVGFTQPKWERKVAEKIQLMDEKVYLPMQQVFRQWSDRRKRLEVPLFPNYIFVHVCRSKIPFLLDIDGLVRFVAFGKQYAIVPERDIKAIGLILDQGIADIKKEFLPFRTLKPVKVVDGPFKGLSGYFLSASGKSRFLIYIPSIGQGISLEMPAKQFKFLD